MFAFISRLQKGTGRVEMLECKSITFSVYDLEMHIVILSSLK